MDRVTAGQPGQWPDIAILVRDALPGQDRTPPFKGVRMSGVASRSEIAESNHHHQHITLTSPPTLKAQAVKAEKSRRDVSEARTAAEIFSNEADNE
jgi:hypothetical protein